MPLNPKRLKEAEELEAKLYQTMESPDSPDYDTDFETFNHVNGLLNDHYAGLRQTDEEGKLVNEPETRLPAKVQGGKKNAGWNYHFEPSVTEVQKLLTRQPELWDELKIPKDEWFEAATPALSMPMPDASFTGSMGINTQAPISYFDSMNEESSPYKEVAKYLWKQRSEEAAARGENVQRYRDVPLKGQPADFLAGGLEKVIDRRLAPAALGAADGASMGVAGPLYDVARERASEEPTDDSPSSEIMDLFRREAQEMPSAEEIQDRSPLSYTLGNIASYGLAGNPTNLMQQGFSNLMKYGSRSGPVKALVSGVSGGAANLLEGNVRDYTRAMADGASPKEAGMAALGNSGINGVTGFGSGALFDVIGQTGKAFHEARRPAISQQKVHSDAGGDSRIFAGYTAPKDIRKHVDEANQAEARGSAGDRAAGELAPRIQQSMIAEREAENLRISEQNEEYFNHPVYGQLKTSGRPLVDSLIEMARRGRRPTPLSGGEANINPGFLSSVREQLKARWAEIKILPGNEAEKFGFERDGTIVDLGLAEDLFGEGAKYPKNYKGVIVANEVSARDITEFEDMVDRILKMHTDGKVPQDPVYVRFNQALKETRDKFPAFEDEAGNLVGPPSTGSSVAPYSVAGDQAPEPTHGKLETLPRPISIEGEQGATPEAQEAIPGIGPHEPEPFDPFDPRARASPQESSTPLEAMARPIDIRGTSLDDAGQRPEGLLGVGPGQPDLPSNPFDPMARTAPMESTTPLQSMVPREVRGSPAEPEFIPPEAIPGPGPRRDRSVYDPDLRGQTDVTGGEYAPPQSIDPNAPPEPTDMAPVTPRMPVGRSQEQWAKIHAEQDAYFKEQQARTDAQLAEHNEYMDAVGQEQDQRFARQDDALNRARELNKNAHAINTEGQSVDEATPLSMMASEQPAAPKRSALAEAVMSAAEGNKSKLADVSSVVKAMGGNVKAAHKAILEAERRGAIELRPEGGLNRLSKDELALTLPGPSKTRLSKIRVIDADLLDEAIAAPKAQTFAEHEADLASGKAERNVLPDEVQSAIDRGVLPDEAQQQKNWANREAGAPDVLSTLRELHKKTGQITVGEAAKALGVSVEQLPEVLKPHRVSGDIVLATFDGRHGKAPEGSIKENGRDFRSISLKPKASSDDVLSPGPPSASGEVKRAADLSEQQRMEEAKGHVDKVDERLGPMPSADKEKMLLDLISKKLGREVTREDLIKAGILSGGVAASLSDDEGVQGTGAAAMVIGGMGGKGPKKQPREIEVKLPSGETRKGFSAIRHRQHERLNALETAENLTGAKGDKTITNNIIRYNQHEGSKLTDDALMAAAEKLGLKAELKRAAAASVHADLKQRHILGKDGGVWKRGADTLGPRIDRVAGVVGGVPRNKFAAGPDGIMEELWRSMAADPTRRFLDLTGGRTGARHGDDFQRIYEQLFPDDQQKEKRP
jgi:hypothetical protein